MTKQGLGVWLFPDGKYIAKVGVKELGAFNTKEEAATVYNKYIAKIFAFPVFNDDGQIPTPKEENPTEKVLENEEPVQFNQALNKYLEEKRKETQQEESYVEEESPAPILIPVS